jgi:hypothetical protein
VSVLSEDPPSSRQEAVGSGVGLGDSVGEGLGVGEGFSSVPWIGERRHRTDRERDQHPCEQCQT